MSAIVSVALSVALSLAALWFCVLLGRWLTGNHRRGD